MGISPCDSHFSGDAHGMISLPKQDSIRIRHFWDFHLSGFYCTVQYWKRKHVLIRRDSANLPRNFLLHPVHTV